MFTYGEGHARRRRSLREGWPAPLRGDPDDVFLVSGNTDRDLNAEFAFVVHTGSEQLNAADFLL
jgi:hypothetical protein